MVIYRQTNLFVNWDKPFKGNNLPPSINLKSLVHQHNETENKRHIKKNTQPLENPIMRMCAIEE